MSKHQLYHIKKNEKKYVHESELSKYEDDPNWLDYGSVDNSSSNSTPTNTNESGEVVVELSRIEEGNKRTSNNTAKDEQIAELDPFNLTDTQEAILSDKEIDELQRIELEQNPERKDTYDQSYSDMMDEMSRQGREKKRELMKEDKRKNLRQSLKSHDPKFDPTNSITDLSPQQFSEIVNGDVTPNEELEQQVDEMLQEWEEDQFGDDEEENESELSESEARDAISSFEDRGGVFEEFAEEIEEEAEIEELEEETERESTPVETQVSKHGNGNATVESNDPQIKSELRSAKKDGFATIIEEGETMKAKVENWEDI